MCGSSRTGGERGKGRRKEWGGGEGGWVGGGGGGGGGGGRNWKKVEERGKRKKILQPFQTTTRICRDYFQVHKVNVLGNSSLVPRPAHRFRLHERTRRPGMFPHVHDVEGRKVVKRT